MLIRLFYLCIFLDLTGVSECIWCSEGSIKFWFCNFHFHNWDFAVGGNIEVSLTVHLHFSVVGKEI